MTVRSFLAAVMSLFLMFAACGVARAEAAGTWDGTVFVSYSPEAGGGDMSGSFTVTVAPDGTVKGGGYGGYDSTAGAIGVILTVTGKRNVDAFHLSVVQNSEYGPGDAAGFGSFDVTAPTIGNSAEGAVTSTDQFKQFPNGHVRLECKDCQQAETWNGDVTYRDQWGKTVGGFTVTVSSDGAVTGTGTGMWVGVTEEDMDIKVDGTRGASSFDLSVEGFGKGGQWHIDVSAPVNEKIADAALNQDALPGTYPQWSVHLECNCSQPGA